MFGTGYQSRAGKPALLFFPKGVSKMFRLYSKDTFNVVIEIHPEKHPDHAVIERAHIPLLDEWAAKHVFLGRLVYKDDSVRVELELEDNGVNFFVFERKSGTFSHGYTSGRDKLGLTCAAWAATVAAYFLATQGNEFYKKF